MILKGNTKNFVPAPEGSHAAVCCDVVDVGLKETQYGEKYKLRLCFQLEATMPETGKPFIVSKNFNINPSGNSLHEKSTIRKFLKSWRGRDFTKEELEAFDIEKVIGAPATLVIQHEENDGTVYANILAVAKATKQLKISPDYKRVKDREGYKAPAQPTAISKAAPEPVDDGFGQPNEDDGVPF